MPALLVALAQQQIGKLHFLKLSHVMVAYLNDEPAPVGILQPASCSGSYSSFGSNSLAFLSCRYLPAWNQQSFSAQSSGSSRDAIPDSHCRHTWHCQHYSESIPTWREYQYQDFDSFRSLWDVSVEKVSARVPRATSFQYFQRFTQGRHISSWALTQEDIYSWALHFCYVFHKLSIQVKFLTANLYQNSWLHKFFFS